MDEIAFVIEDVELAGVSVDPVVNGERLATRLGSVGTVGMWPDGLAAALLPLDRPARAQVLRCGCGEAGCDYVTFEIEVSEREVVWRNIDAGGGDVRRAFGEPLTFGRSAYETALEAIPDESAGGRADQPSFRPLGMPQTYLMMVAPGRTPPRGQMVLASFEINDTRDVKTRAEQIAAKLGLAGDPSLYRVGPAAIAPGAPRFEPFFPADADLTAPDDHED